MQPFTKHEFDFPYHCKLIKCVLGNWVIVWSYRDLLHLKTTNSPCMVNGRAVRIFVNVRQLMHPRMVFEVRSAWLQRAGDLDKVSTDSKGTGQVVISTPILLLSKR